MQLNLTDVSDYLPDTVHEMIRVVGMANTQKIIRRLGGISFNFFTNGRYYKPLLCELIGEDAGNKLIAYFKGETLYIPRCGEALRVLRNRQFKYEYDFLTQEKNLSGNRAMLELCPKYQISDRQGWHILSQQYKSAVQPGLF